jgi:multidrug resistance efflux pump
MQTPCQFLVLLGLLGAAPSQPDSAHDPLDFCELTIIDEVHVPAEEAGVLISLNAREGDLVEKGALLGQIDDRDALLAADMAQHEYEAAKEQAENQLSVQAAIKSRDVADAENEGAIEANRITPGTVPKFEVRRKKFSADRAAMQIDLARHELTVAGHQAWVKYKQLQRARDMIERRKITSRLNGVVVEVLKHAGDWVNPGDTVMRIVRMDQLRVEGFLNGTEHARHEVVGRPVDIEVQLTGGGVEKLEGKISFASPLVESNEYKVWAEIDNVKVGDQWLLNPGLNARMKLRDVRLGSQLTGFGTPEGTRSK